jgi:hypothetical protein
MISKLLFFLVKLLYTGKRKNSILLSLSQDEMSKDQIIAKMDHIFTACHNGYQMYLDDPEKIEEMIEFFSSEAENIDDFSRFLEEFNAEFNLEVTLLIKETFNETKNHLTHLTPEETNQVLDKFFMHKSLLNKTMNKMLNLRIVSLDEKITVRGYLKTVSGENSLGIDIPDDKNWN